MMDLFRRSVARFQRRRLDEELQEEIRHHLELRRQRLIDEGLDPDGAEREAHIRFGNVRLVREEASSWWGFAWLDVLGQDVRYGLRMLAKSPVVTATAIVSLAVAIGASAVAFSFANAYLFRPLHAANGSELVQVFTGNSDGSVYGGSSYADYLDFRDRGRTFRGLLASTRAQATLSDRDRPDRVTGLFVSGNYFEVLGLRPSRGRFFRPEENAIPGAHPVVVLSHHAWRRRFRADPDVVGQVVGLSGHPFTVIGVGPSGFSGTSFDYSAEFFVPVMMQPVLAPGAGATGVLSDRRARVFTILGRLNEGVTLTHADATLRTVGAQLFQEHPDAWQERAGHGRTVTVLPEIEARAARAAPGTVVWILTSVTAAVGVILGIACVNVATLLMARAAARRREIAVRLAIGASRRRVVRQLLTECALLAGAGAVLGLVLAQWGAVLFERLRPAEVPPFDLTLDSRVLAFGLGASLITIIIAGLAPALQTARADVNAALKAHERKAKVRRVRVGLRDALVVVQVATSVTLVASAALLFRSFLASHAEETGFRRDGLLLVGIDVSMVDASRQSPASFYREAVRSVGALSGSDAVTLAGLVPMDGSTWNVEISIEQNGLATPVTPDINVVGPGYFRMMGIQVLRGREFTDLDREGAPHVAIVNESMARRLWAGDAVGRTFRHTDRNVEVHVVGVIRDLRHRSFDEAPRPMVYFAADQYARPRMTLHVRTSAPAAGVGAAIVRAIRDINPAAAVALPRTMAEHMDVVTMPQRMGGLAAGATGFVELCLAVIALYGVIAYAVSQRTREIAVRLALGAPVGSVTRLITHDGLVLAAVGVVLGMGLSLVAAQGARSLLIGIGPADPVSYAVAAALVFVVAAGASYVPARRVQQVDPNLALRSE